MKVRDSGMPHEEIWSGFFSPADTLRRLGVGEATRGAADFGCGYGTFAIPAAATIRGRLHAFDIEEGMIAATRHKAEALDIRNIVFHRRDFVTRGTGLADESVDAALLCNILHAEEPVRLLGEAWRILRPPGIAAIMHWNPDPSTPRGPPLDIRPTPQQCRNWALEAGFAVASDVIDLPPWHYGLVCRKAR